MRVQVLGVGSTILSDDGLGIRVIERLRKENLPDRITLTEAGTAGAVLLDIIEEGDRLIIIDVIQSGARPGTIHELSLDDLSSVAPAHLASSHGFDLITTLSLARGIGDRDVPRDVAIIAVEAVDITTFAENCTPEVERAIDEVVKRIKTKIL